MGIVRAEIMLKLTYAQLEALIAALHNVHDDRLPALNAKFKHLRRLAFPAGVNVGSEKRFGYDLARVVAVALAFDLFQAFVPPRTATRMISREWGTIWAAARRTGLSAKSADASVGRERLLIVLSPRANAQWALPDEVGDAHLEPMPSDTWPEDAELDLGIIEAASAAEMFEGETGYHWNGARIVQNFGGLLARVDAMLIQAGWATVEEIRSEYERIA